MLYLSIPSHLALSLLSTANKFHNEYKSQELQRNKTVGTQKVSLYGRYFLFSLFEVYTKKAWSPTVAVPRIEALALPVSLEQQREAHAEYKIYSRANS